MPTGAKRVLLHLTPTQRQLFEAAAARERITLQLWLVAAAELAMARGSTR